MGSTPVAPSEAPFSLCGVGRIPLRNRHGQVRAYATVDLADFADVGRHRWCMNGNGYVLRSVGGQKNKHAEFLHRRLLGLGRWKEDRREGDHIDRDPLNNRRANLRIVTHAQNQQNMSAQRQGRSPHRGVAWATARQRWSAWGRIDGRKVFLGYFHSESLAAEVAAAHRRRHMPFATD